MYEDKTMECKDCGSEFVFTAGEQEFFNEKGFQNEPSRCPDCRIAKKRARRANVEMHTVTCAECGGEAVVPFEPKNGKPVLCSDCYEKSKESTEY